MAAFDEAFIALIIAATEEFIQQWGRRPTVQEVLKRLSRQ